MSKSETVKSTAVELPALKSRVLTVKQVMQITSLGRTTIYNYLKDPDSPFPRPIPLKTGHLLWNTEVFEKYLTFQVGV